MTNEKNTSGRGQRELRVRVKTAKGRKLSSTLWLERQLNDPYVQRAKREGYRGRAAYKILELDDKLRLPQARCPGRRPWLRAGRLVPGRGRAGECAWRAHRTSRSARCWAWTCRRWSRSQGPRFTSSIFSRTGRTTRCKAWLGGRADVVMSDMAAASSGHKQTDHLRIVALCEAAADFAFDVLEDGGTFVAKVLAGGAEIGLQTMLKKNFTKVANVKPPASRSDSSEKFVVAMGFRGRRDWTTTAERHEKGRQRRPVLFTTVTASQPPQDRTGPQSM